MESGRVKVDQQKKQYDFEIKGAKIFATCNEISRLSKPLQSSRILQLPRYNKVQFINIFVKVLKNFNDPLVRYIGHIVFEQGGDIRTVMSVGKLLKNSDEPEDVNRIIQTLMKYGVKFEKEGNKVLRLIII
jgi:hypothetical protein